MIDTLPNRRLLLPGPLDSRAVSEGTLMRRLVIASMLCALPAVAAAQDAPAPVSLRLQATATRAVPPDFAVVRFGINTQGKRAAEAGRASTRVVSDVLAALRQSGVPLDSVFTGAYVVEPARDRTGQVVGYVARADLHVVLQDLDRIGAVIDAALEAGATDVAPASFAASFLDAARDSAYVAAVLDVYRRAEAVATAMRGHLVGAVDITASEQRARVPCAVCTEVTERPDQTTVVTPGLIAVTVHVSATFRIEVP